MRIKKLITKVVVGCAILVVASACNGVLDGIYDRPNNSMPVMQGQLYMDATDWNRWYYVDFDSLAQHIAHGDSTALLKAQTTFVAYPVPTARAESSADGHAGIYTYWFDVFGKGIASNEQRAFMPTASQAEPPSWSIAIHRNNVRTNGAEVLETNYTSLADLPASSKAFAGAQFIADEWTQNEVWVDRTQMLQSLVGCQGIKVNRVLSSWLKLDIPPMPPAFTINSHVFIVRFPNGKMAAVQLENYMNAEGIKCWLTINYKYPY